MRWCEERFLRKKSDVFTDFKEYRALMEKQFEKLIGNVKSHTGTEYRISEFDYFLIKSGIKQKFIVRHTLEQNRIAENKV